MASQDGTLSDIFNIEVSDLPKILSEVVGAGDLLAAGAALEKGMVLEWNDVLAALVENFARLLDMNVKDILAAAWKSYSVLAEQAEKTRCSPEESALVPLTKHTVESEHHPSLEILVSEASLLKLEFEILLTIELEGALVTIENGKITKIQPGQASGKASLSCGEKMLLERSFDASVLPAALNVEPGIEIPSLALDDAGTGGDQSERD